jgi:hypothetical protein
LDCHVLLQVLVDAKSFDAAVSDFDAALALAPAGEAAARQGWQRCSWAVRNRRGTQQQLKSVVRMQQTTQQETRLGKST